MSQPSSAVDDIALAYSNNFWGKSETGVNVLLSHVNNTKHTAEEIKAFYKERAAIEEDYAKRLIALSRKGLGSHEVGTLKAALDTVRVNTETLGKSHANAASQFKKELEEPLAAFAGGMRVKRKAVQAAMDKLNKAKLSQQKIVDSTRERFEADSNKLNGYAASQNLLLGKELERNNQKLEKVHISIEISKRDYQNAIRDLAEIMERWTNEWKVSCDKLQDLDEERVNFFKSNLWAYTNIVSTACVSDDEGCENIRVALEKCDVTEDFKTFIRERGTGNEIMDPPEFIDYTSGNTSYNNPQTYSFAQFSRSTTLDVESQDYYDTNNASSMMSRSIAPSNGARSSGASFAIDSTMSLNAPQFNRDTNNTSTQSYSNSRSSFADTATTSPAVNYATQNNRSSFADTTTTSPAVNYAAQNNRSSYIDSNANTTYSDSNAHSTQSFSNSKLSYTDTNNISTASSNLESKYQNIPIISGPDESNIDENPRSPYISAPPIATEKPKPVAPTIQASPAEEPRRTWASPFSRKSRKDLNKNWNVSTSPSAERSNTLGSSANNTPETSTSPRKGVSTMLSMGGNMFDLGVSPFDQQRARSSSPVKSFAKDDPLVMALEKLKTTDTPAEPDQSESISRGGSNTVNPYGVLGNSSSGSNNKAGKRVPSRSAPVSPLRNNGSSTMRNDSSVSLVPPAPAFTATKMKSTKVKYSTQTKEMFDYDSSLNSSVSRQQSFDNRPRSNASFRGDQISHRSSNASFRRPQTMYDTYQPPSQEFDRHGSYISRSPSPNPMYNRNGSVSPSPYSNGRSGSVSPSPYSNGHNRSVSPSPYSNDLRRSASPNPHDMHRGSVSPNPQDMHRGSVSPNPHDMRRAASPNPHEMHRSRSPIPPSSHDMHRGSVSPRPSYRRSASPNPGASYGAGYQANSRSASPNPYQPPANVYARTNSARSGVYSGSQSPSQYDLDTPHVQYEDGRRSNRSSIASAGPAGLPAVARDGRPVAKYCRAVYDYNAQMEEEVSFRAKDILLVVKMLADGWWEAEVLGTGRMGLAPNNFLIPL